MSCRARGLRLVMALAPFLLMPAVSRGEASRREIDVGVSSVSITGPWKFHTGDEAAWAQPDFDDRAWEEVDLTAPEGAHDGDVGFSGYVPGWSLRGHSGYRGYAWYRTSVEVRAPSGAKLALAGPGAVESAYQLFIDGDLAGGRGTFGGRTPTVLSILPQMFPLQILDDPGATVRTVNIAIRVWLSPREAVGSDYGGVHVAPVIGTADAISGHYQVQWFEIFRGYVVDAILAAVLVLLGMFSLQVRSLCPKDHSYRWLGAALIITGLVRGNQATYSWFQFESLTVFDFARNALLVPLGLGAWAIAWQHLLRVRKPGRLSAGFMTLTLLYLATQSLSVGLMQPVLAALGQLWRLLFLIGFGYLLARCLIDRRPPWIASALAMMALSIGLFASELSAIGIPGIWFPYGTGVSRTQYAFGALAFIIPTLIVLHLREGKRRPMQS